jgi:hypothetical protein
VNPEGKRRLLIVFLYHLRVGRLKAVGAVKGILSGLRFKFALAAKDLTLFEDEVVKQAKRGIEKLTLDNHPPAGAKVRLPASKEFIDVLWESTPTQIAGQSEAKQFVIALATSIQFNFSWRVLNTVGDLHGLKAKDVRIEKTTSTGSTLECFPWGEVSDQEIVAIHLVQTSTKTGSSHVIQGTTTRLVLD